jgi:outer membrane lipoprotein-sorting protein
MIRKILTGIALVGFLAACVPAMAHKASTQQSQGKQQATKSVTGKVASIGDQGKSFALEVNDGSSKRTMNFVVDKNTQVQGRVTEGTIVAVEYQPSDDGQNLCVRVTAQG